MTGIPGDTSMSAILASSVDNLFSIDIKKSLTSVQHDDLADGDGDLLASLGELGVGIS